MESNLNTVPRKVQPGFTPGIGIIPYAVQSAVVAEMDAQEPIFLYYALRVMNDEVWNFIDGRRSIAEISESVCQEFGFELDPGLFLPLVEELKDRGLVTLETVKE